MKTRIASKAIVVHSYSVIKKETQKIWKSIKEEVAAENFKIKRPIDISP